MNRLLLNTKLLLSPHYLRVSNSYVSTEQSNSYFNFSRKQISDIRNTPIRVYETKFRQNYSHHYWKISNNAYDTVWKNVDRKQLKTAQNCFNGLIVDLETSFFFPAVKNASKLITLIEMQCWFFLIDDYIGIENRKVGIDHLLETIEGKKTPEKQNEIIIDGITRSVRQCYTDAQYNRYIDSVRNYLIDCSKEVDSSGENLNSVDEMVEFRDNLIGCKPFQNLFPFSLDIDITEHINNQILNRMESLIVKHITLVNDLYSMKKELAQRDRVNPFNALIFLYNQFNSLEQSVDKIFGILDSYENEYFHLRSVLQTQYTNSTELHQYIDCLEYFGGGNVIWELFAPRYNKYNGYSLKDVVFNKKFAELIPVVEKYTELFAIEKELV